MLLIGAGLFLRTLSNLSNLGPGFPAERLVGFQIDPSRSGYTPERATLFYQQLTDSLGSIPGVQSVGLASMRILENNEWDSSVTVEGYNPATPKDRPEPYMNQISPNYFATLGVPIVLGRDFTVNDNREVKNGPRPDDWTPTSVMINEKFARLYFQGQNPIGRHIGFGGDLGTHTDMEVIGVVKDIKYTNLRDEIPAQAYVPYLGSHFLGSMTVYLRTAADPKQVNATCCCWWQQESPSVCPRPSRFRGWWPLNSTACRRTTPPRWRWLWLHSRWSHVRPGTSLPGAPVAWTPWSPCGMNNGH